MTTPNGPHVDSALRARLTFGPMTKAEAAPMIERHYLGRWPGVVMAISTSQATGQPTGAQIRSGGRLGSTT